ncbi:MAG: hypothetical protein LLG00_13275 [Planctomycetaceae bacterium]|nr:hypothetical protein [Planctomycetaceae bacterium]
MRRVVVALATLSVVIAATVCLTASARSDAPGKTTKASSDDLKQLCEEIVTQMSRGEPKGYALLVDHTALAPSPSIDEAAQGVLQVKAVAALQSRYGEFLGCEFVRGKKINDTLRRCDYLAKYEKHAVVWTFVAYRVHDQWRFIHGNWYEHPAVIDALFAE